MVSLGWSMIQMLWYVCLIHYPRPHTWLLVCHDLIGRWSLASWDYVCGQKIVKLLTSNLVLASVSKLVNCYPVSAHQFFNYHVLLLSFKVLIQNTDSWSVIWVESVGRQRFKGLRGQGVRTWDRSWKGFRLFLTDPMTYTKSYHSSYVANL